MGHSAIVMGRNMKLWRVVLHDTGRTFYVFADNLDKAHDGARLLQGTTDRCGATAQRVL